LAERTTARFTSVDQSPHSNLASQPSNPLEGGGFHEVDVALSTGISDSQPTFDGCAPAVTVQTFNGMV
jgi:hypothetical protein